MTIAPAFKRWAGRLAIVVLALPLHSVAGHAQEKAAAPGAAKPAPPSDTLGRDTPRGTLVGFMRAARAGNHELAFLYLNTPLRGEAAFELARKVYVVLDSRLPARLNELSDSPEGSLANPLKPDEDVVGTISTADGPLDLVVERVSRVKATPIWLVSRRTLDAIPDVYDEIDVFSFDDYLPDVGRPRLFGIRLFEWIALLVVVPLLYRAMGALGLHGFVRLLVLAIAIRWVVSSVDLPLRERQLWTVVSALLVLLSATWMLLRANAYGERYLRRQFRNSTIVEIASLVRLGRRLVDILIVAASVIVALTYFGVEPTAALAGLGIGGIAVALAAQKTLENVIGGLSLIFDGAVRVGDFLKLGESFGTVDSIGLRSTRIRTLDRTLLSVPNGQIANATIETLSARDMCWFHHVFGVRYETTSTQLRAVIDGIRERLAAHPSVDAESLRVRLFRFGPSSLDIEIFAYVRTGDWVRFLEIQEMLLVSVIETVEQAGAAFALPAQTLHISERAGRTQAGSAKRASSFALRQ
jgi:MscS family membrane protein